MARINKRGRTDKGEGRIKSRRLLNRAAEKNCAFVGNVTFELQLGANCGGSETTSPVTARRRPKMARPCRQALTHFWNMITAITGDLARRTQLSGFSPEPRPRPNELEVIFWPLSKTIFLFPRPVSRICDPPGPECLSRYQNPHAKARQRQLSHSYTLGHLPRFPESQAKQSLYHCVRTEDLRQRPLLCFDRGRYQHITEMGR